MLAFAHVPLVAQRVRRRPGVVDLRADREPLGERIADREANRLVGQLRAAFRIRVGVVAESDFGLGRKGERVERLEVVPTGPSELA